MLPENFQEQQIRVYVRKNESLIEAKRLVNALFLQIQILHSVARRPNNGCLPTSNAFCKQYLVRHARIRRMTAQKRQMNKG